MLGVRIPFWTKPMLDKPNDCTHTTGIQFAQLQFCGFAEFYNICRCLAATGKLWEVIYLQLKAVLCSNKRNSHGSYYLICKFASFLQPCCLNSHLIKIISERILEMKKTFAHLSLSMVIFSRFRIVDRYNDTRLEYI